MKTKSYDRALHDDISAILRSRGSEVLTWEGAGPGGTDLEAYWRSGTAWLVSVRAEAERAVAEDLSRLRLRATGLGATPVVCKVSGKQLEFHSAVDDALLEVPEDR